MDIWRGDVGCLRIRSLILGIILCRLRRTIRDINHIIKVISKEREGLGLIIAIAFG